MKTGDLIQVTPAPFTLGKGISGCRGVIAALDSNRFYVHIVLDGYSSHSLRPGEFRVISPLELLAEAAE